MKWRICWRIRATSYLGQGDYFLDCLEAHTIAREQNIVHFRKIDHWADPEVWIRSMEGLA